MRLSHEHFKFVTFDCFFDDFCELLKFSEVIRQSTGEGQKFKYITENSER